MPYDISNGLIGGANLVGGLIRQGQQTQDYVSEQFDAAARRRAGGLIANGDAQGAAAALGARGLLPEAATMRNQATAQTVLTAANAGDYTGARRAAAEAGNPDLYGAASSAEASERAQRVQWLTRAADALSQIPAPIDKTTGQPDTTARHNAFVQQIAPTMKAMGLTDEQIAQVEAGHLTDESLATFRTSLAGMAEMDIRTDPNSGDIIGVDKRTGATRVLHQGTHAPVGAGPTGAWLPDGQGGWTWRSVPHTQVLGADQTLVEVGGDGSTPATGGAPGAGGGVSQPTEPQPTVAAPHGPVWDRVRTTAMNMHATPAELAYLARTGQIESGGNTAARNGSSTGFFQFHPDTFHGVLPHGDIGSVEDQTRAALLLARQNEGALRSALGREPTAAELYIAHQQGAGGTAALFNAPPETNAVTALTPAYRGNAGRARQAVVGNGGTADMTAGGFLDYWRNRYATGQTSHAPATAGAAAAPPTDGQPAGARVIARGSPRPQSRPPTTAERATYPGVDFIHPDGTPGYAPAGSSDGPQTTDARDIELLATAYLRIGGQALVGLGSGRESAALRRQVIHRAALIEQTTGELGGDAAQRWMENRGAFQTLSRVRARRSVIEQQASEANRSADLLLQGMPDGHNGSNPILNRPWRATLNSMGSGGVSQFNIAVNSFGEVYARVMTGATGSAAATEGARNTAHRLLNPDQSPAQIRANITRMRAEMAAQTASLDEQEAAARAQIRSGARPTTTPAASFTPREATEFIDPRELARRGATPPAASSGGFTVVRRH